MNKFLTSVIVVLVLAVGGLYLRKPSVVVTPPAPQSEQLAGAAAGPDHYTEEHFYNGLSASSFSSTPSATVTSTTSPAALGAGASGFITFAAGTTLFNASSTAIGPASILTFQPVASATAASLITALGTTLCNPASPSTTPIYTIFASSTNPGVNGFSVSITGASSRPFCLSYRATNKAN